MGSGNNGSSSMGLTPPSQPTGGELKLGSYTQSQDFSSPVNFGGDSYGLSGGGNQLTATNKETGKSVSSKDYKPEKDLSGLAKGLTSFQPTRGETVSFRDYGFSPQQTMMPAGASPFASPTSSALWGDDNDRVAVEQFLEWQKRMGY